MRKKKLLITLYCFGMAVFAIWLILSSTIIVEHFNHGSVKAVDFESIKTKYTKDDICYALSNSGMTYRGGILQKIFFDGWALCETKEDNTDRQAGIVLHNVENGSSYDIQVDPVSRVDIPIVLPSILHRKTDVPSANVGIKCEISALNFEDGIYDIYLYCYENEVNYGFGIIPSQMEKSGDDIKFYSWSSHEQTEPDGERHAEPVTACLDGVNLDKENVRLFGWGFVDGKDSADAAVTLQLEGSQGVRFYSTRSQKREDVAKHYESDLYEQSGWYALVPLDRLESDMYSVRVLVENQGEIWSSRTYAMEKTSDGASIIWCSGRVDDAVSLTEEENTTGCLDSVSMAGGFIDFRGWEFVPGEESAEQTVTLEITDASNQTLQYETKQMSRLDVSAGYGEAYSQSGWRALVPASDLSDGTYSVRLLVSIGEKTWTSRTAIVSRTGADIHIDGIL